MSWGSRTLTRRQRRSATSRRRSSTSNRMPGTRTDPHEPASRPQPVEILSSAVRRRVVVTGVGLVSPLAVGTEATWRGLLAGRSGVARITHFDPSVFPSQIAGEVKGFNPQDYVEKKDVKKSDAFIHFALAATKFAVADSGLTIERETSDRLRVVICSGIGGPPLLQGTPTTPL